MSTPTQEVKIVYITVKSGYTEAQKKASKKYYEAHKAELIAKVKQRYQANRETLNAKARERYHKLREELKRLREQSSLSPQTQETPVESA